jgi:hypothetical protein
LGERSSFVLEPIKGKLFDRTTEPGSMPLEDSIANIGGVSFNESRNVLTCLNLFLRLIAAGLYQRVI